MKKLLIINMFCALSLNAMESQFENTLRIQNSSVKASHRLGKIELYHDDNGFHVIKDEADYLVKNHQLDPLLRKMSRKHIDAFQKVGYFAINKTDNDEFFIRAHARGLGGGPLTGAALYWLTKTLCYGTALAGAGAAVAVTGGGAGAFIAGTGLAAGGAVATAGATVTMAGVAGGLTTVGLAGQAGLLTTGVIVGTGSVAGAVAAVETASLGAFALGTAIPFLP